MALADIETKLTGLTPVALSAFRIVVGFLFFLHGASHLFGWPLASYLQPVGTLPWWAGIIEFLGGAAIILGLGTRIAAFVSSGAMAVAYFTYHQPEGLLPIQNNGEGAALYSWIFLLLVFTGGGSLSLDRFITRAKR
ncbi:phosphoribosylaminoimidazolecarboxamide formyltransferase [Mycobacteroides chelonae]|jgi:putative oxidoreductase|uniref:DoxX family protein n=1 Tax=Mycobacteroides chelonae TaxID=1774 RepID=UPI0008A98EC4|nr:DoxX family protein [Mycobacteroides chelonae]MBF9521024.1 DoxX family protein [Mycobacteroides chelonae]OHU54593.1 phosphoribosylaminoimidazolecarboxamide formyltransferase [Mycobacteroides chelonae]PKQ58485.1 phosphoribosylaminoimidazolecarboxamide formyltransferase [Mycobacterium sp. MHSD3]SKO03827.1 integral membrane protein [Mycobacteroides abscessus subsp. bolletii]